MSVVFETVELPRIKRKLDTWEGKMIQYLLDYPSKKSATDLALEALTSYWLPLALKEEGVKGKALKSVGQKAIAQLMQQIEVIRLECELKLDEIPFGATSCASRSAPVLPVTSEGERGRGAEEKQESRGKDEFWDDGAI